MKKVAVVYWSGTGNTELMANAVASGVNNAGGKATLLTCSEFDSGMLNNFDSVAFGCPSMGVEQLEEEEFEPMFDSVKEELKDKPIALFGSYGWGDGEWMENWEEICKEVGANLAVKSIICQDSPNDDTIAELKTMGEELTK